ncbi:MAG: class II glutamine amidotransferase [Chromatiaceae bacterium]|nr:class II glutamine amidotransferase [Gammaproteobacteria bacterium]MCP5312173.1 class II glutamine amidotransferase [Chromatiaceae bacterium]
MCELFAMSSRCPTTVDFSLELLARRGGDEGPHRDGWGVAFYGGRDVLLLREPGAASESALVRHIERHGPPSELVISHIRLATVGELSLANTQPFARELGGRMHVFAHNGDLPEIRAEQGGSPARFLALGETDSELAFCNLMTRLAPIWDAAQGQVPSLAERLGIVSDFARELRRCGTANFLYSDGEALFVHSHRRTPPGSEAVCPGMHVLERSCEEGVPDLSRSGVVLNPVRQALTLVASVPLTQEDWRPLGDGEILAIERGRIAERQVG